MDINKTFFLRFQANLEALQHAEKAAVRAFVVLSESLSEVELMPVFGELADWVEEAMNAEKKPLTQTSVVLTVYTLADA